MSVASVGRRMDSLEVDSVLTGISSTILPSGRTEEQLLEVYSQYNFKHKFDEGLSITKYQEEVTSQYH